TDRVDYKTPEKRPPSLNGHAKDSGRPVPDRLSDRTPAPPERTRVPRTVSLVRSGSSAPRVRSGGGYPYETHLRTAASIRSDSGRRPPRPARVRPGALP